MTPSGSFQFELNHKGDSLPSLANNNALHRKLKWKNNVVSTINYLNSVAVQIDIRLTNQGIFLKNCSKRFQSLDLESILLTDVYKFRCRSILRIWSSLPQLFPRWYVGLVPRPSVVKRVQSHDRIWVRDELYVSQWGVIIYHGGGAGGGRGRGFWWSPSLAVSFKISTPPPPIYSHHQLARRCIVVVGRINFLINFEVK